MINQLRTLLLNRSMISNTVGLPAARPPWSWTINKSSDQFPNLTVWYPLADPSNPTTLVDLISPLRNNATGGGHVVNDPLFNSVESDFTFDSINTGNSADASLTSAVPFSVSLWIKQPDFFRFQGLAGKVARFIYHQGWDLYFSSDNGVNFRVFSNGGADAIGGGTALVPNTWNLLTFTWDTSVFSIYLNGTFVGTGSLTGSPPAPDYTNAQILVGTTFSHYYGMMTDLRIWEGRALTALQVAELYAPATRWELMTQPVPRPQWPFKPIATSDQLPNLTVWYPLTDPSNPTTIVDLISPTRNDAVLATGVQSVVSDPVFNTVESFGNDNSFQTNNTGTDCDANLTHDIPFTISFWIDTNSQDYYIARKKGTFDGWYIDYQGTRPFFFLSSNVGANVISVESNPLPANQWVNLAFTWDGTNIKAYTNGADSTYQTDVVSIAAPDYSGTSIILGGGGNGAFYLTDFRIYEGRALSSVQIAELYYLGTRWSLITNEGLLGEEYVSPSFVPHNLSKDLLTIYNMIFDPSLSRVYVNYRLREIMSILHTTELAAYVYALDSRVTYWPMRNKDFFTAISNKQFTAPSQTIANIWNNLKSGMTSDLVDALFGVNPPEPYKTFRNLWESNPYMTYSLGGLVLALGYRINELVS